MMQKLSTKPLKGFRDFIPEEWTIQQYIFNTWKRVCESYGYKEYNGPVLESIDIYNKSGDDVGTQGKELYAFEDRGGRKVTLRPEMTPTVGRMIAEYTNSYPKPIRWYSIAQFFRAENPQRGRGREFFQLNFDIFGSEGVDADLEILMMAIDILVEFGATTEQFVMYLNDRTFMNSFLLKILGSDNLINPVLRILDKKAKVSKDELDQMLKSVGLNEFQINQLDEYSNLTINDLEKYKAFEGYNNLAAIIEKLKSADYWKYCEFRPSLARGFDYYTGMVFEVFDKSPQNNRSMFGGGRYDKLLELFSNKQINAVGCAPGDVTTRLFLESWDLLPNLSTTQQECYYAPILSAESYSNVIEVVKKLRKQGNCVIMGIGIEGVAKALSNANKLGAKNVLLLGEEEISKNVYKVKNLDSGSEVEINLN